MADHIVFLCIGGNLGERLENLEETRDFLTFNFGDIETASSVYETEAWEMQDAPAFLNQVIRIKTELSVEELLLEIKELEEFYGRERGGEGYQSREMDVDILFYDDLVREDEKVIIPHPRLHERKFVLVPLAEIAPELEHPKLKKNVTLLLKECEDKSEVKMIE